MEPSPNLHIHANTPASTIQQPSQEIPELSSLLNDLCKTLLSWPLCLFLFFL